jgi:hypothetical protein
MGRNFSHFHFKAALYCFSDEDRKHMPYFNKLAAAYEHVGCTSWFIVVSPPTKVLGSVKRLSTGPDSEGKKKALRIVRNERFFCHRDWQLNMISGVLVLSDSQADKEERHMWTSFQRRAHRGFTLLLTSCTAPTENSIEAKEGWFAAQQDVAYLVRMKYEGPPPTAMMPHGSFFFCEHHARGAACRARQVHPGLCVFRVQGALSATSG